MTCQCACSQDIKPYAYCRCARQFKKPSPKSPSLNPPFFTLPRGWRIGQTMQVFFWWLLEIYGDPFHISDDEFTKLYQEFLEEQK